MLALAKEWLQERPEWIYGGAIVVCFAWGQVLSDPNVDQIVVERSRNVIDECWKHQAAKTFSAKTQKTIAGHCQKFEEDHRKLFGSYYTKAGKKP